MFSLAKKLQPCIVFIDEIDAFLRCRQSTDNESTGSFFTLGLLQYSTVVIFLMILAMMKAQFMSLWDGFSGTDDAVIVMGATNRPNDVDTAILRRMPSRFFIQLPDECARAKILETILRNEYIENNIDYEKVAKQTKGFSGSDLKEVCRISALSRLQEADIHDADWLVFLPLLKVYTLLTLLCLGWIRI